MNESCGIDLVPIPLQPNFQKEEAFLLLPALKGKGSSILLLSTIERSRHFWTEKAHALRPIRKETGISRKFVKFVMWGDDVTDEELLAATDDVLHDATLGNCA